MVPAPPEAVFVVVHAQFPFAFGKTGFNGPALPAHPYKGGKRSVFNAASAGLCRSGYFAKVVRATCASARLGNTPGLVQRTTEYLLNGYGSLAPIWLQYIPQRSQAARPRVLLLNML